MAHIGIAIAAALGIGLTVPGSALASSPDLCPELERTTDNPDGNRDCGPGCVPESEFGLDKALTALAELEREFIADMEGAPPADEWESTIARATNLIVLRGTLLQMQLDFAKPAGPASEAARRQYCDFLRSGASYLD